MLNSIEGIYRNGTIELLEVPSGVKENTHVIVTFLQTRQSALIDLRSRGIDKEQAADLRARLSTFAGEWDSPGMEIYNDYDKAKSQL